MSTNFTDLVGCRHALQLAPMGGVGTPELVAVVANAGAHAMLAATTLPAPALAGVLQAVADRTTRRIGVNFLVPLLDRQALELAAAKAGLIEFFFGDPNPALVQVAHDGGALASWQVGSVPEALAAEDVGCDLIVVQGTEAGGRLRGREPLAPLLVKVLEAATLPVVAAGGIATPAGVRAVLDAGAAAARVGTRFLAAVESGAHPLYKEAVLRAGADDAVETEAFSILWPLGKSPARVLKSCLAAAESVTDEIVGELHFGDRTVPVPRYAILTPSVEATGQIAAMAMYAGTGVGEVIRAEPAAEIVRHLIATT